MRKYLCEVTTKKYVVAAEKKIQFQNKINKTITWAALYDKRKKEKLKMVTSKGGVLQNIISEKGKASNKIIIHNQRTNQKREKN